jgi:hypothetical protein
MNMAGMDCKFSEPKPGLIPKSPAHLLLSLALFRSIPQLLAFTGLLTYPSAFVGSDCYNSIHRAFPLPEAICVLSLCL